MPVTSNPDGYDGILVVLAMRTNGSVHVVLKNNKVGAVTNASVDATGVKLELRPLTKAEKAAGGHAATAGAPRTTTVSLSAVEEIKRPPNG